MDLNGLLALLETKEIRDGLPFVSIRQFGVEGSPNALATTGIQKAINEVEEGTVLYFPPGTYISSGLVIPKNIHILGSGKETLFLKAAQASESFFFKIERAGGGEINPIFENFVIDGNQANQSVASYGIFARASVDGLFKNVEVKNNSTGILTQGLNGVEAVKNRFVSCIVRENESYGIHFASPFNSISDSIIEKNGEHGVVFDDKFNSIHNSLIYSNSTKANGNYDGIFLGGVSDNAVINGNTFSGDVETENTHRTHIFFYGKERASVFGNAMRTTANGLEDKNFRPVMGFHSKVDTDYSWSKTFIKAGVSQEHLLEEGIWRELNWIKSKDYEEEFDGQWFIPKYFGVYSFKITVILQGTSLGRRKMRLMLSNGTTYKLDVTYIKTLNEEEVLQGNIEVELAGGVNARVEILSESGNEKTLWEEINSNLSITRIE